MKKVISILLILAFAIAFSACSTGENNPSSKAETNAATAQENTQKAEKTGDKKILVTYFSAANTNGADEVSSATPKIGDSSVTEYIANLIHETAGGDIKPIIPQENYPADYNDTADKAKAENESDARPKFTIDANPEEYDVVFVGYPIWWYEMPMIMDTFFDSYDFGGKTIVPFNVHEGSGDGGTYDDIKELEPSATVIDGFNIRGESEKSEIDSGVKEWLEKIDY